jgi:hypothetical protein
MGMYERRKRIRELNGKRREILLNRDRTLEGIGRSLFERLDNSVFSGEESEYRRFRQEIADSEQSIRSIQDAVAQIKQLDEEISIKKQEKADRGEELAILLTALGKEMLNGDKELPSSLFSGKRQLELCLSKKETIEGRIQDIENSGGGIFAWISGRIKMVMLRSSLKKNDRLVDQIYYRAGKKCLDQRQEGAADDEPLLRDALALNHAIEDLETTLKLLEDEKQKVKGSMGAKGNPARRIKSLEEQAGKTREDLQVLYRKMGENAASGHPSVSGMLNEADRISLEKAEFYLKDAGEKFREIEQLETAIAVDRERGELERLEKDLDSRKRRLADDERSIIELNRKIAETRERIEQLHMQTGNNNSDEK